MVEHTSSPLAVAASFEVACGSVLGRDHALAGRNAQDAYCCRLDGRGLAAVVCDGCSSGKHSEVGAKLGAALLVEALGRCLPRLDECAPAELLESVRRNALRRLGTLARALGPERVANVNTYFLFTAIGALIGPRRTVVFLLGDGLVYLNGRPLEVPPYNNRPPYLCYGLIEEALESMRREDLRFRILADLPTAEVHTLALGSDGASRLAGLDGGPHAAGGLSEFWTEDRFFSNPQALTRRLVQLNRGVKTIDWEARRVDHTPGPFLDDTTLVVIRRREAASVADTGGERTCRGT
jgi:hypothetical protein